MKESIHIAPAKINLALEIIGKRPDGYHELNTLFYKLDQPHDIIAVGPSTGYLLTTNDRNLNTGSSNLITRAVKAVTDALNEPMPRCAIHLTKRIPTGAGLGGGSSDAAVALQLANEIFGSRLSSEQLRSIATTLGADVPFFLGDAKAAVGSGIGDKLWPIDLLITEYILIVKPSLAISTKEAYASLKLDSSGSNTDYAKIFSNGFSSDSTKKHFRNDFEAALFQLHPELPALKKRLYELSADFAQMTGSGAAFYALFSDAEKVERAQVLLQSEGYQVFLNKPAGPR